MGVHKLSSNKKKTHLRQRDRKAKHTYNRVKNQPKLISEIPDSDVIPIPDSTFSQRKKNSRTNVTISGKKKRKIMKQLKRLQKKQGTSNDVDMEESTAATSKSKKSKKTKQAQEPQDEEMETDDSDE